MNETTKRLNKKFALDTLDTHYHVREGIVKINTGNTLEHELAKFLVCWELAINKHEFITEGIFKTGQRCDILDITTCEAWEIVHTEKDESLLKKINNYPVKTYGLNAKKVIENYRKVIMNEKDKN